MESWDIVNKRFEELKKIRENNPENVEGEKYQGEKCQGEKCQGCYTKMAICSSMKFKTIPVEDQYKDEKYLTYMVAESSQQKNVNIEEFIRQRDEIYKKTNYFTKN